MHPIYTERVGEALAEHASEVSLRHHQEDDPSLIRESLLILEMAILLMEKSVQS
jgi:hypothetical protein